MEVKGVEVGEGERGDKQKDVYRGKREGEGEPGIGGVDLSVIK